MSSPRVSACGIITATSTLTALLGAVAYFIDDITDSNLVFCLSHPRRTIPLPSDLIHGLSYKYDSTCEDLSLSAGLFFANIFYFIIIGVAIGSVASLGMFAVSKCRRNARIEELDPEANEPLIAHAEAANNGNEGDLSDQESEQEAPNDHEEEAVEIAEADEPNNPPRSGQRRTM